MNKAIWTAMRETASCVWARLTSAAKALPTDAQLLTGGALMTALSACLSTAVMAAQGNFWV